MSFVYAPSGGGTQPVATGSSVASAPVNLAFSQVGGAFNNHVAGTQYAHSATAGAGGVVLGAAIQGTTAAATGATDLWTMIDRIANAIGVIGNSSSVGGSWVGLSGIPAGGGVNQATALATANALARRDGTGGIAFANLSGQNIIGTATSSGNAAVYARGAPGDPAQFTLAVQNNAGTVNRFTVDASGNTVASGNATQVNSVSSGIVYAGSAVTQVTDSVGLVRLAALPVVDRAHGGFGFDMTNTANFATVRSTYSLAQNGTNSDISALTGLTTPLGAQYGGTGLISPAAGSIPVTNGTGAWNLLPPTPANYFVVSNGTTYVAQPFATTMIPNGALNQSVMSALFPSAGTGGGNLLKVQAQPWVGFINGLLVTFVGGTANYSPAIDPTGIGAGQSRIDLLVLNSSGNLAWSQGTPSATPSMAATLLPANAAPIWYVKVYQGATSITGYTDTGSQAAFIQDARNLFGPTTAVASGGASTLLSYATMASELAALPNSVRIGNKPILIMGGDPDFTAEVDPVTLFSAGLTGTYPTFRIDPSLVKASATEAPINDTTRFALQPDIPQRISINSTTYIATLTAGSGGSGVGGTPVTIAAYGASGERTRTNSAAVTSNALPAGTNQAKYLIADLSGTGPAFTILWSNSNAVGAYQVLLATYWYDSTAVLQSAFASFKAMGGIYSNQVALMNAFAVAAATDPAFSTTTGFVKPANMNRATFTIPEPSNCLILSRANGLFSETDTTSNGFLESYAMIDDLGTPISVAYMTVAPPSFSTAPTGSVSQPWSESSFDFIQLAAGTHTITQVWKATAPAVSDLYLRRVQVLVFGLW